MKSCQYVWKFFNLMRIQTYDYDAKLITAMKVHHHHHFSFHLGHQCYEVTPFINVSNFTFVILVLLCHFDTSLDGTVGGWLDVWDKSIIKTNSLTWRYGYRKSCKHQPTFNDDGLFSWLDMKLHNFGVGLIVKILSIKLLHSLPTPI